MGKRRFMGEAWGYDNQGAESTPASRLGSTGIKSHTRGWNLGIEVVGSIDQRDDSDYFEIYATGGSNGERGRLLGVLNSFGFYPTSTLTERR